MKYSNKVSDSVHILTMIAINTESRLTSAQIAESVHTNAGCVRQLMSTMKKAGLIISVAGHPKPALAKAASEITLLDIYKAVEGDTPLLHLDTHVNPACGVGMNIQFSLQEYFDEVQAAAETAMAKITLQNIIDGFFKKSGTVKG